MLALIAGQGALPGAVHAGLDETPLVCALEGFAPDHLSPDLTFRIEHLGRFLADLAARDIREVCFAGRIGRPRLDPAAIEPLTLPLVPRMMTALRSGDDAALRVVLAFFEEAGFVVRAPHQIAPDLLPPAGTLTIERADHMASTNIARARDVLAAMGRADLGQSCVVSFGQVLAVEASLGTDWMLASLAQRPEGSLGGLLYKAPKPQQDRRIDLPAIGPQTVAGIVRAGLAGIVIEAQGVMILERDATIAAANAARRFIKVIDP